MHTSFWLLLALVAAVANAVHLPPIPDTSAKCLECEGVVKALDMVFGDADSAAAFVAKLEAKCGSHDICKKLVDEIVKIPEGIFKGLKNVAWPDWGLCALIQECQAPCCNKLSEPEQIHLSLAATDRSLMGVSWVTLSGNSSIVEWGTEKHKLSSRVQGSVVTYTKAGWVGSIHRAAMTGLVAGTKYYYRVGDSDSDSWSGQWSETYSFTTLEQNPTRPLKLAVIADMAYDNMSDDTVKQLAALAEAGRLDGVIHSGDISYADGFQPHFDTFMNKVQDIAARVPYMVAPGNHEFGWNFAAYKKRFFMPGSEGLDASTPSSHDNMYFPWTIPHVQFVALSSETEIDTGNFNKENVEFLQSTLAAVDRAATPWVIMHCHRPLYCTQNSECGKDATHLKNQIEDILQKNHVDMVFSGHVHAYQRSNPVYKNVVTPGAPVYFMQGGSGNREGNAGPYSPNQPPFVANSQNAIGYGMLTVAADGSSLGWEYFASADNALLDSATYKK